MTEHVKTLRVKARQGNWLVRAWRRVREPRVISVLAWVGYVALTIVGAVALAVPPTTVEAVVGPYAMYVIAGLVAVGGLASAVGSLPGWRGMECLGISAIMGGASIYMVLVLILTFTSSGNRSFQAGFILFALVSLASRWIRIKDHTYAPGSRASQRAIDEHPELRADTVAINVPENSTGPPEDSSELSHDTIREDHR